MNLLAWLPHLRQDELELIAYAACRHGLLAHRGHYTYAAKPRALGFVGLEAVIAALLGIEANRLFKPGAIHTLIRKLRGPLPA
jgi:hypothetical protein